MNKIFANLSKKDSAYDLSFETKMVMYRFLSEIEKLADENDLSRKKLAQLIETSPSFITQLFRGSKTLNLETIAKFQRVFDGTFKIEWKPRKEELATITASGTKPPKANSEVANTNGFKNLPFVLDAKPMMSVVSKDENSEAA